MIGIFQEHQGAARRLRPERLADFVFRFQPVIHGTTALKTPALGTEIGGFRNHVTPLISGDFSERAFKFRHGMAP